MQPKPKTKSTRVTAEYCCVLAAPIPRRAQLRGLGVGVVRLSYDCPMVTAAP